MQSKDGGSFPAATTVDIPTGWDPRASQSPSGALVTVLCTAALFDSRTGQIKNALARTATPVDIPNRWDPRANQSPTGALATVLRTAALFDSRTGQIKNALACMRKGVFMTRTGIEPMLQP